MTRCSKWYSSRFSAWPQPADLHLGHQPSTMFFAADGDVALRGFDRIAEEEANWLVQEIASAMGSVDRFSRMKTSVAMGR